MSSENIFVWLTFALSSFGQSRDSSERAMFIGNSPCLDLSILTGWKMSPSRLDRSSEDAGQVPISPAYRNVAPLGGGVCGGLFF